MVSRDSGETAARGSRDSLKMPGIVRVQSRSSGNARRQTLRDRPWHRYFTHRRTPAPSLDAACYIPSARTQEVHTTRLSKACGGALFVMRPFMTIVRFGLGNAVSSRLCTGGDGEIPSDDFERYTCVHGLITSCSSGGPPRVGQSWASSTWPPAPLLLCCRDCRCPAPPGTDTPLPSAFGSCSFPVICNKNTEKVDLRALTNPAIYHSSIMSTAGVPFV